MKLWMTLSIYSIAESEPWELPVQIDDVLKTVIISKWVAINQTL